MSEELEEKDNQQEEQENQEEEQEEEWQYPVTIEEFKKFFRKDFNYAPEKDENEDGEETDPENPDENEPGDEGEGSENGENTEPEEEDDDFVYDEDIERAMEEADVNFNSNLFGDEKTAALAFKYLTAFYLTVDQNNADSGGGSNGMRLLTERHVRNVGESFAIPKWVLDNPMYSIYAQNGYGTKYLSFLVPRLVGIVGIVPGRTLP